MYIFFKMDFTHIYIYTFDLSIKLKLQNMLNVA